MPGPKGRLRRPEREMEPPAFVCPRCGEALRAPEGPFLRILAHGWAVETGEPLFPPETFGEAGAGEGRCGSWD